MHKTKFSEEQTINIFKGVETGQRVADACRVHGISEQTYHCWKAKYGKLDVNEKRAASRCQKTRTAGLRLRSRTSRSTTGCSWTSCATP